MPEHLRKLAQALLARQEFGLEGVGNDDGQLGDDLYVSF
jgi:hypothetical protein